jgi:hypothetical protein
VSIQILFQYLRIQILYNTVHPRIQTAIDVPYLYRTSERVKKKIKKELYEKKTKVEPKAAADAYNSRPRDFNRIAIPAAVARIPVSTPSPCTLRSGVRRCSTGNTVAKKVRTLLVTNQQINKNICRCEHQKST